MSTPTNSDKPTITTAETMEKHESEERQLGVHVVTKVHADGHVDLVDARAIGGDVEGMPPGYYYSVKFIGTVIVSWIVETFREGANSPRGRLLWKHMRVPRLGTAS